MFLTILIASIAFLYVAYRIWRFFSRKHKCQSSCDDCPISNSCKSKLH
ncbi:MAG: FeoB-associated Cys-rich membrane protein [Prevotellaceae bacterium]|nr:FeoB-associated Cys-rich membrane protein [Candidatus Colivivens equi]